MTWQNVIDLERDVRELESNYWIEEETEAQARERMTEAERERDLDWIAARYGIPAADACPEEQR